MHSRNWTSKRNRTKAIKTIKKDWLEIGKFAIVTGHFMLWSEFKEFATPVYTEADLNTFTHILYLDTPAKVIEQ